MQISVVQTKMTYKRLRKGETKTTKIHFLRLFLYDNTNLYESYIVLYYFLSDFIKGQRISLFFFSSLFSFISIQRQLVERRPHYGPEQPRTGM